MLATINGFDFLLACTITALICYVAYLRDSVHQLNKYNEHLYETLQEFREANNRF